MSAIRAAEPILKRDVPARNLLRAPGSLAKALDIDRSLDGVDLCQRGLLWLASDGFEDGETSFSTRIGITRDAHLPIRFFLKGSKFVSAPTSLNRGL
jgi:DNA-3-methyladenine glycosylase